MSLQAKRASGPHRRRHGIFCLEGDWDNDLNEGGSVRPILDLVGAGVGGGVPYRYRDVATRDELFFYLDKWTQRSYQAFPILYLAFHGSEACFHLSDGRRRDSVVTLDELGDRLEGRCARRVIHFGSCETVRGHGSHLNRFLRQTGALAITGYRGVADWTTSAAFELLLLSSYQSNTMTLQGVKAVERRVKTELYGLQKALEFRIVVAKR